MNIIHCQSLRPLALDSFRHFWHVKKIFLALLMRNNSRVLCEMAYSGFSILLCRLFIFFVKIFPVIAGHLGSPDSLSTLNLNHSHARPVILEGRSRSMGQTVIKPWNGSCEFTMCEMNLRWSSAIPQQKLNHYIFWFYEDRLSRHMVATEAQMKVCLLVNLITRPSHFVTPLCNFFSL